jgi:predicted nuclease of predicted toxin-antitoxin system
MKLLLDTCVWGGSARQLTELGHDVLWSGAWEADPGDREILHIAHQEGRVLITLDKDFGELAIVNRYPHSGVIRLVGIPSRQQADYIHYVLRHHGDALALGAIVTLDQERLRIRKE